MLSNVSLSCLYRSLYNFLLSLGKMALPLHKRYEIVFLSQHQMGPKLGSLGYVQIGKLMNCSKSTVKYWVERYQQDKFSQLRKICRSVKHPAKVNVWGCFSSKGFGRIVCFTGNLNANKMCVAFTGRVSCLQQRQCLEPVQPIGFW